MKEEGIVDRVLQVAWFSHPV